jgi:putative sigma-54 modulation protein
MQLQVRGKNVEVTDAIRGYAEQKLRKLERHLSDQARCELELAVEKNPSIAASHVAEATIWTKGPVIRAREASEDMRASIDQLIEKLERQATRYREKRRRSSARANGRSRTKPEVRAGSIVKTKQFPVGPLSPEEAVDQLELIGHDFFLFRNAESDELNVLYRRNEGGYGLIEPSTGEQL